MDKLSETLAGRTRISAAAEGADRLVAEAIRCQDPDDHLRLGVLAESQAEKDDDDNAMVDPQQPQPLDELPPLNMLMDQLERRRRNREVWILRSTCIRLRAGVPLTVV